MTKFTLLIGSALFGVSSMMAQQTFNVSADPGNPVGVFGGWAQPPWSSGDIALAPGTTIGTTPLQVDLLLSHDLTLDGSGHYGWLLNYAAPGIAPGDDLGTLDFNLLEHGSVVASVSLSPGPNNFGPPPRNVTQFGTGFNDLTPGVTFDEVDIFVSNQNSVPLTDLEITLNTVPDGGLTIAMLGMGISGLAFIRRKR